MTTSEYDLLIPFVDKSETFTLGWECGQIYQSIVDKDYYSGLAHVKNLEQIQRIAKALKCSFTSSSIPDMGDEWIEIEVKKLKVLREFYKED